MYSRYATITLAVLAKLSLALVARAPLPGYGVEDFTWEVQAYPDGPLMNLTGSIDDVHAQLVQINPNYERDFPLVTAIEERSDTTSLSEKALDKRFGPVCGPGGHGWKEAQQGYLNDGIRRLRSAQGQPTNGPGPGNCGRLTCDRHNTIWWCNDNPFTFSLPGFNTIADCVKVLLDQCARRVGPEWWVVGQNFNGNNWNCIVRLDDTC
ncbi:hypothetical protein MKX08_005170 [Trichoderma sp. CBMAI-0020]|nr:hypothetical protein MKX08_005170 [Trichoderma sp. CBMAI-0020]